MKFRSDVDSISNICGGMFPNSRASHTSSMAHLLAEWRRLMWHLLLSFAAGFGLAAWIWLPGYLSYWESQEDKSWRDHWEV